MREVEEPFGEKQKGSSAMPHKRNPVGCEQVTGLARLVRANALAALENVALWHERDISHSSVERVIVPDSFLALDHMLRRFTDIVRGHDRERRAHAAEPRLDARPRVLRPAPAGADRARACAARTPTASCRATPWRPGGRRATSAQRVAADPEVRGGAEATAEIAEVFRLERYLGHVDAIFARVFGPAATR